MVLLAGPAKALSVVWTIVRARKVVVLLMAGVVNVEPVCRNCPADVYQFTVPVAVAFNVALLPWQAVVEVATGAAGALT